MKQLFAIVLIALVAASIYTWKTTPGAITDRPVLYWVTDPNPARAEQIRTFAKWLKKHHPDAPDITIIVDTANMTPEKVLIQGISGVCGDLIDHTGGPNLRFRKSVGILEDITDIANEMGFGLDQTSPSVAPELVAPVKMIGEDGSTNYVMRQFAFPCNYTLDLLWVNRETFAKHGVEIPPKRWTIAEFERVGKEFVTKANRPGEMQRVFFISDMHPQTLAGSMGGAIFNETQTAPVANSAAMREAMELRYRWTFETPRLLPTVSERNSFASASGYGGAGVAMFAQGNYALFLCGRYMLIQFRVISAERVAAGKTPLDMAVVELPHGVMPVGTSYTRATAIYTGGKHSAAKNPDDKSKQLARYFMAFLASEDYNMNIVRDADGMPPNPKYAQIEEFKRPPAYPDEWEYHEPFEIAARELAVAPESTPFGVDNEIGRVIHRAMDSHINGRQTAAEALKELEDLINAEIARSLKEDPDLVPFYEQRVATQQRIDDLRSRNEPVPLSWITNPYWRKWYQFHDWADVEN